MSALTFACKSVLVSYTRNVLSVQCHRGLFFKKKKDISDEDAQEIAQLTNDQPTYGAERNKDEYNILTTKRSYYPPSDVEDRVQSAVTSSKLLQATTRWQDTPITDARAKFEILTKLMKSLDHHMSSSTLNDVKTANDVLQYFQTEVRATTSYQDLSKLNLPANLHIEQEYRRFDPETDQIHDKRTAFPGMNTVVTSIKNKRKFNSIKLTKEKAGYANHYFDY